jgi:hypothetical protein
LNSKSWIYKIEQFQDLHRVEDGVDNETKDCFNGVLDSVDDGRRNVAQKRLGTLDTT